jgi:hypothetical protein
MLSFRRFLVTAAAPGGSSTRGLRRYRERLQTSLQRLADEQRTALRSREGAREAEEALSSAPAPAAAEAEAEADVAVGGTGRAPAAEA